MIQRRGMVQKELTKIKLAYLVPGWWEQFESLHH